MRIAITAGGKGLSERFDSRFGRAAYFIICDTDSGAWEAHSNVQNFEAAQGAGIQAAQTIQRLGAAALVTGHVGPKAFKVLQAGGVKVFSAKAETAAEALAAFRRGELTELTSPDVEGHWV